MITLFLLIYVAVASYILGKVINDPFNGDSLLFKISTSILWPFILIVYAVMLGIEIVRFLPLWDIIQTLIFRRKIKGDKELVISYYNEVKDKKGLWNDLKRKTAEKVAKDNNINLNEEILEIGEDD